MSGRGSAKVFAVLLGVGLVVAACSSSSKSSSSTSSPTTAAAGSSGGSSSSSSAAGAAAGAKQTINVGMIMDITGIFAPFSGPSLYAMEAEIQEFNAQSTAYHVNYKVYDTGSSDSTALNAARQAIADHDFAVLSTSGTMVSGVKTLSAAGVPVVGMGENPGWIGPPNAFSAVGNIITVESTSFVQQFLNEGRKKIGIVVGNSPGAVVAISTYVHQIPIVGGSVCFQRSGVNSSNTASLAALAHEIIAAGCQGVLAILDSNNPGLQQSLNALGGNVQELEYSDVGPSVTSAYGKQVNNLIYANTFASPYTTGSPGVNAYLSAMKTYEPSHSPICICITGYIGAKFFTHALSQLTAPATPAALIQNLNSTNGYDEDGLVGPIHFPAFHTDGTPCDGFSVIKDGQWTSQYNGSSDLLCGRTIPAK
jgi:ABC-type branched-subunit amino acid transport system substrate-binding protein